MARFRLLCKRAGLTEVLSAGQHIRFGPADLPDSRQLRLNRLYPGSMVRKALRHIPGTAPDRCTRPITGTPVKDAELLAWASKAVVALFLPDAPAAGQPPTSR